RPAGRQERVSRHGRSHRLARPLSTLVEAYGRGTVRVTSSDGEASLCQARGRELLVPTGSLAGPSLPVRDRGDETGDLGTFTSRRLFQRHIRQFPDVEHVAVILFTPKTRPAPHGNTT